MAVDWMYCSSESIEKYIEHTEKPSRCVDWRFEGQGHTLTYGKKIYSIEGLIIGHAMQAETSLSTLWRPVVSSFVLYWLCLKEKRWVRGCSHLFGQSGHLSREASRRGEQPCCLQVQEWCFSVSTLCLKLLFHKPLTGGGNVWGYIMIVFRLCALEIIMYLWSSVVRLLGIWHGLYNRLACAQV